MIHGLLKDVARTAPPTNGLKYGGVFISYAEMAAKVARLAAGFRANGIEPGDPVALLLPNSPDMFAAAHALFALGAVAMPLSLSATHSECAHGLKKSHAVAIVAGKRHLALAEGLRGDLAGGRVARVFASGDDGPLSLEQLARTPAEDLAPVAGDAPALYLLSSGSTGMPKVVVHTQASIIADGKRTSGAWDLTEADTVFDMLPGNFAMGLLLGATDALTAKASVVYWHDARPLMLARQALLDTLVAERVTMMGAVPAMYEALAGAPKPVDLSGIRLAFSGGAALSRPVFDACRERLGLTVRQSYGLTEASMVSHNDSADIEATWQSIGRPAGDAEIKLDRADETWPEGAGEILIKSSSVMRGYLDDPAETAGCFDNGWLRTGDLARIDAHGRLYIVGRSKLLIDCLGYKIDPIEVEHALEEHAQVLEAAVIGVPGRDGKGQRLKAIVVPVGDPPEPEALIDFLRVRLSAQKVPSRIAFTQSLPKSPTGKLLRRLLPSMD